MKKLMQSLKDGKIFHFETPVPAISNKNEYLIKSRKSLISTGTEKMLLEFGKSNYIEKALQQPDKVKQTLEKINTDGFLSAYEAVSSKLNQPIEMGYCNVGIIQESFQGGMPVGTRVVSNGSHASYVAVPKNLVAKIPDNVTDEQAAFAIPSSIALQGIRLLKPDIGESVLVFGLGLIGLLTVQILKANGCSVYGIDIDKEKCAIAEKYGALCFTSTQDYTSSILTSNPEGIDGVIITASTKSNEVIDTAAKLTRKRGRIILVGVVGLNLDRSLFYDKELTFQVSCSYGPGRYNRNYEEKNLDFPIEYVRWTENRNFQAALKLMQDNKIVIDDLVSERFSFDDAVEAYEYLRTNNALGLTLEYKDVPVIKTITYNNNANSKTSSSPKVSFIGAGNYASRVLMPSFQKAGFEFSTLQTKNGSSANQFGKQFNFHNVTTDNQKILSDDSDLIVIATRHDLHANQICDALANGKNVFVEKPLVINFEQLEMVKKAYIKSGKQLMVGFNRRFSPLLSKIKNQIELSKSPKSIMLTMNAGKMDRDHWTQDKEVGGGRIIGEACHYIDLLIYLLGTEVVSMNTISLGDKEKNQSDSAMIAMKFSDGSIGSINYLSNGSKSFPKERVEVFFDEKVIQLNNFKSIKAFGIKDFKNQNLFNIQKGQDEMARNLHRAISNGSEFPININEIFLGAELSLKADSHL